MTMEEVMTLTGRKIGIADEVMLGSLPAKTDSSIDRIDSNLPLEKQRKLSLKKHNIELDDLNGVLSGVIYSTDTCTKDKISAIKQVSKMNGLDAPIEIKDYRGGILTEFSEIPTEVLREIEFAEVVEVE